MSKVGILHSGTSGKHKRHIDALGISPGDMVGGQPLYADDDPGKLDTHAKNLVSAKPNVLVAAGGTACSNKMQEVTKNAESNPSKRIPVVFTSRADTNGLEQNVTGISASTSGSDPDRLELLNNYFLSAGAYVGVLYNSSRSIQPVIDRATQLGLKPVPQAATDSAGIDTAFKNFSAQQIDALIVAADPLFNDNRPQVIKGADDLKKPAIYQWREFAEDNGLISYGTNLTIAYTLAGMYVGRILADPTNLPKPLKLGTFELVINLKTAHSQSINIPEDLLAHAHDVIV
jgi:putative ABC transport system substrate-binding protein